MNSFKSPIKFFLILITLGAMLLYVPANRIASGGSNLELPLDSLIPLVPIFVVPYLIGLPFWIGTVIYIIWKRAKQTVASFDLQMIIANVLSVVIYLVLPTFVTRPNITGTDIFSNLVNLVYGNDRTYNAAPSGHTFNTIICAITLTKLFPKYKPLWIVITFFILASTVFTKQHNIADVMIGAGFALIINWIVERLLINRKLRLHYLHFLSCSG